MTSASPKELTQRFYDEIFTGRNVDLIDELVDENFVEHEEFPGLPAGREGAKAFTHMLLGAIPDLVVHVEDMIAGDGKVVARIRFEGTHQGELMGILATGRKVDFAAIDVLSWRDGRATEHWGVTDSLAMLTQLGVVEPPD